MGRRLISCSIEGIDGRHVDEIFFDKQRHLSLQFLTGKLLGIGVRICWFMINETSPSLIHLLYSI